MTKLTEYETSLAEGLLISLSNLSTISGEMARKGEDLTQILLTDINAVDQNLDKRVSDGYVTSYCDHEGNRGFYLTSIMIVRVCSLFI